MTESIVPAIAMLKKVKSGNVPTTYRHTKKEWVEFPGGKKYFLKSSWERRYANYLEILKKGNAINDWQYEVDTFWFDKIKRGVRSYTPDFKIFFSDGSIEYHEVKGWMDGRSKTKIKRMKKYHPSVKLIIIGKSEMRSIGGAGL